MDRLELIRFLQQTQTISVHHGALAYLLGINALRASEAATVRIEDYQETLRGHRVLHLIDNGAKPATMPLTVPVLGVLEACRGQRTEGPLVLRPLSGRPIDRRDCYPMVVRIAKAAGIPRHVSPHSLRHAAITNALDAGVPLRDAQILARHADPRTTEHYDRARDNLDRHGVHILTAYVAPASNRRTQERTRARIESFAPRMRRRKRRPMRCWSGRLLWCWDSPRLQQGDLALGTEFTSSDLDQWSNRRDAQGQLPAVVRQLIMSTVRPERIRFPADEGIALKGLDGILSVPRGAPPYVPAGDSAWEASTQANSKSKASDDYQKRTEETAAEVRANTTFVFVTTRSWNYADWVKDTKALGSGWKDIRVLDAQDLATWLSMCPGVHAWLSAHLNRAVGLTDLARWIERWSMVTDPPTPAALLLAGRRADAICLLNYLDGHPAALR